MHVTVQIHRSRPDDADRVFAESEGVIDSEPATVKVTYQGVFLCVLKNGREVWFGVSLSELVTQAVADIEAHFRAERRGA